MYVTLSNIYYLIITLLSLSHNGQLHKQTIDEFSDGSNN